jgi:hypothetical protein
MPDIQIDMFEVQLGAAILLQFTTLDGPVRVLADAGIKASGYDPAHVHRRLLPILDASGDRRIDLILGTHYDEDHLNGLVPIIEDDSITIGEAWMPPVANDVSPHALDAALSVDDLLPHQFYAEDGEKRLAAYLSVKRSDCETLLILEGRRELGEQNPDEARDRSWDTVDHEQFFRSQLEELISPDDCFHGADQEIEPDTEVDKALKSAGQVDWRSLWLGRRLLLNIRGQVEFAKILRKRRPRAAEAQRLSLANIRRGAAKDAINAKALNEVIKSLRHRRIPVRTEIIDSGVPRSFFWQRATRRFSTGKSRGGGLELSLLGPSRALVRKHWNRLPIEDASRVALSFFSEIKSITPSNQLSYIARFGFSDQGILISGDAGCVDFKQPKGKYYQALLDALLPLHVIQVAHHGGNNAHFYRVLDAAKFPHQGQASLLLLSHATNDRTRPSSVFRDFLLHALEQDDQIKLLFTSQPRWSKIVDYEAAIHPVVGSASSEGDVRIVFNGRRWEVKAHAVAP